MRSRIAFVVRFRFNNHSSCAIAFVIPNEEECADQRFGDCVHVSFKELTRKAASG